LPVESEYEKVLRLPLTLIFGTKIETKSPAKPALNPLMKIAGWF
jgi:hypothetical protein